MTESESRRVSRRGRRACGRAGGEERRERALRPHRRRADASRVAGEQPASARSGATRADEIVFEGTFEEINDYFRQQLVDGRAADHSADARAGRSVPASTPSRAPDEPIAVLPQANLPRCPGTSPPTRVMAGCRPEHMPVLIAAVEAIADDTLQPQQHRHDLGRAAVPARQRPGCGEAGHRERRRSSSTRAPIRRSAARSG